MNPSQTDLTQEQRLLEAYRRVSYLCRCLLQNDRAAETLTREILSSLPAQEATDGLALTVFTAQRCLDELTMLPPSETTREIQIPEDAPLTTTAAAGLVQQIVDALPEEQRISLVLYCCGMDLPSLSQLTYTSEEEVSDHLNRAQEALRQELVRLSHEGADFPVLPPLPELLTIAMEEGTDADAAAKMVDGILGKQESAAKPSAPILPILGICLGVAVIAFFLWKIPQIFRSMPRDTQLANEIIEAAQETAIPETTAETEPPLDLIHGEDGHTHDFKLLDNSSFDCESGGTVIEECRICGMQYSETRAPGAIHDLKRMEGLYDREATCTAPAQITMVCLNCLHFYPEDDHMTHSLGHDMEDIVHAPTQTEKGYTAHTCTRCGYSEKDTFVDPLPPETTVAETTVPETTAAG